VRVAALNPRAELNDGSTMPRIGFGVFQVAPEQTVAAVSHALRTGYRAVDTAAAYGNEREVGKAIRGSGVGRGEVFVTTSSGTPTTAASPRTVPSTGASTVSGSTTSTCTSSTGRPPRGTSTSRPGRR
jgi:aryl-alcohol dehydrogenase-like predicted oxidoreductase